MKNKTILTTLLSLTVSVALLAGCDNGGNADSDNTATETTGKTSSSENSDQYPIVIKHPLGETVIESKPERIAAIGWDNQDTPLSLGVIPVGVSAANYGKVTDNNLHPWTAEAFTKLGEDNPVVFDDLDGFDYEGISDTNPDVILAAYSGITQEEYDLLSEIAPVVPYEEEPWQTHWRDQTIRNAVGMGMKSEGEAKVAEVEDLIKEKTGEHPELAGTKAGFFWINPDDFSTFYAYMPTDPRASYLTDLGLVLPDSVLGMADDASAFSVTISRENADQLNDVELMVVYGDEQLLAALQADELMSQIPAIKNGAVLLLDSTSALAGATTPSVLSIPAEIDEYLSLLSEAHSNIK